MHAKFVDNSVTVKLTHPSEEGHQVKFPLAAIMHACVPWNDEPVNLARFFVQQGYAFLCQILGLVGQLDNCFVFQCK